MLFLKLSAFYFFYFAAVGVYVIFLPKALLDIGYSPKEIGIVLALAPLMRFATPFLFLKHIELTQTVFKATLILATFTSFLFYFTIENFYLFMINNAILGVCISILLPYMEVISLKELGSRYGKSRLYGSIGFMLISLVVAQVLSDTSVVVDFYFGTILLTSIIAYSLLQYDGDSYKATPNDEKFSLIRYWPFWVSLFLMQVSFGGFYNFFTIYESEHGISLETISYLWAFGVVCEILMLYYQSPILKNNLLLIIKFTIVITAFRWFLVYLFPENLMVIYFTQSLHAFSFGLYHSAVILYLYNLLYSNKKLAQQFMLGVAYGLGGFVGGIVSGWSYGEYLFLYCSLIALISYLFLLKFQVK